MADVDSNPDVADSADVYKAFRKLSPKRLWEEVPRFNALSTQERIAQAGLIRALGVSFSASGTVEEKARLRSWLCELLNDPAEKVRRYAIHAIPKLRSGEAEEKALLELYRRAETEREKGYVMEALNKMGGRASLEILDQESCLAITSKLRMQANVARREQRGGVCMDATLTDIHGLRIHLRCRKGLEQFVREEFQLHPRTKDCFRLIEAGRGLVALRPIAPFSLGDLYSLRCCATVGFVLGLVKADQPNEQVAEIAQAISAPMTRRLLRTFHEGTPRYRLEFMDKRMPIAVTREIVTHAFVLCPEILNDSHQASWSIDIHPTKVGQSVELRARISPDPRFPYREHNVAAASHPPLAASLARWAGRSGIPERIWDPFCGSGLELIESALLGGVESLYGSDLSQAAIDGTQANVAAAALAGVRTCFRCVDFRDFPKAAGLKPESLTLVISNPPLGRRIRIPDLKGLMEALLRTADRMLQPGGRLVFTNPIKLESPVPTLHLESRIMADLGGFDCRLEKYLKVRK